MVSAGHLPRLLGPRGRGSPFPWVRADASRVKSVVSLAPSAESGMEMPSGVACRL